MINKELGELKYYLNSISWFMRSSFGIKEQCETYFGTLKNMDTIADTIFSKLDVFNPNYFVSSEQKHSIQDDFLDILGKIFGISRVFNLTYTDTVGVFGPIGDTYTKTITLNNYEMLVYIQAIIYKNNFDGTNEYLIDAYNTAEGELQPKAIEELGIMYSWSNDFPLVCNIYFSKILSLSALDSYPNIVRLYFAGLLTLESLGISYSYRGSPNIFIAIFDEESTPTKQYFDPDIRDLDKMYGIFI